MIIPKTLQFSIVAVVLFFLAVLLGLAIVKVVDYRLSRVSINMPAVNINLNKAKKKYNEPYVETFDDDKPIAVNNMDRLRHTTQTTYYVDPEDMTADERKKFMFKANFKKMTRQDYVNWLRLFKEKSVSLPLLHYNNLTKLISGKSISKKDFTDAKVGSTKSNISGIDTESTSNSEGEYPPKSPKHMKRDEHINTEKNQKALKKLRWKNNQKYN